jgi:hypothetical protein
MSKQLHGFKDACRQSDIKNMKNLIRKFHLWEQKIRVTGEKFMIYKGRQEFIMNCHGTDFLPDDFRYGMICSIMDKLLEYDFASFEELQDKGLDHEMIDNLVDIYNHVLLQWAASNLKRAEYVNSAVNDGYADTDNFDLFKVLAAGQYLEIRELFDNVINELSK